MAEPKLNLQKTSDMFKQAAISFRANIELLLLIAILCSICNTAVENSMGMAGLSLSVSNGKFSLDFDFQDKQNHILSDTTSGTLQQQKLFTDGNNNGIMVGGQAGQNENSLLGHMLSSYFVPPSVDDASEHLDELIHDSEDRTFGSSPVETYEGQGEQVLDANVEIHEKQEWREYATIEEDLANDNIDYRGPLFLEMRMLMPLKNETQKKIMDDLEESEEVGIFAGRLFGGRGLDQPGAMPQGTGAIMLLILLLFVVLATLLVLLALQHSAVLGAVAFSVVSTYMNKRVSIRQSIRSGLKTGMWRLIWLAILHGCLRALRCLFLMNFLFAQVLELEEMETLVLRLTVMPFAFQACWKDDYATDIGMSSRIGAFLSLEYLFDALAYTVFIIACWVAIMERQYRSAETLYRGWNLVKRMAFQAATIKFLESVVCGRSFKWILQQMLGHFLATLVISLMETYFLVLWLVFYFSARTQESQGQTRHFSLRDLEDFYSSLR